MPSELLDLDGDHQGGFDLDLLDLSCPQPVKRPVMVQQWLDVVFLHWRYPADAVQRLLPPGVTVDTFDGCAWVGLIPFRMEGLGIPGWAPLPIVGRFPEINVRTYVRAGARRGVWFFSLDIDQMLSTLVARGTYQIPYCAGHAAHSRAGDLVTSRTDRRWPRAHNPATGQAASTRIAVRLGAALESPDPLAQFLTSRWGLISASRRGRLRYAPVDHEPWPLHSAELLHLDDHLVTAAGLPAPEGDPHVMWSPGVDVRVGRPLRCPPPATL